MSGYFVPPVVESRLKSETPATEITCVGPIVAKSLVHYLQHRGISREIASDFLQEVHYRRGNDRYFALGFPNHTGGYELRSQEFKGSLGTKDISVVEGRSDTVLVFEGFFDFLTWVARLGKPDATVVVLNSVAMKQRAVDAIKALNPTTIRLYLDSDPMGKQTAEFFQAEFPHGSVVDESTLYAGYKDLNEWHVQTSLRRS